MKKVFISQPMKGKSKEEILQERMEAVKKVSEKYINEEVVILDSYFEDFPKDARPLYYLGKSLELLSECDVAVFAKGWKDARGCKLEHECAKQYGYDILYL